MPCYLYAISANFGAIKFDDFDRLICQYIRHFFWLSSLTILIVLYAIFGNFSAIWTEEIICLYAIFDNFFTISKHTISEPCNQFFVQYTKEISSARESLSGDNFSLHKSLPRHNLENSIISGIIEKLFLLFFGAGRIC